VRLPSYDLFNGTEVRGKMALERMLAGVSSRRYCVGLEPAGQAATATSKSAVPRRFAAAAETAPAELVARRLDGLDLVAFMVDGVHFGEHACVVALGIGIDGVQHPLGVEEGPAENAAVVTGLIAGLRDRGLDVTRPVLAVLDGSKALARAVRGVFDKPVIHRCQEHKIRNVIGQAAGDAPPGDGEADAAGLPRRVGAESRRRAGAAGPRAPPGQFLKPGGELRGGTLV
jgi:hypothetical protein